jgi:hypothetical protein
MQTAIHIFKTNINSVEQIKNADSFLSTHTKIEKWNIDLDDCDKVLRIETSPHEINDVIQSLAPFNIYCEVLE